MNHQKQHGGFAVGLIVGLLIGLTLALGVALYVTKVPVPFVNKVPQRTAVQDAAEIEKNKNWNPNGPLSAKPPPGKPAGAPTPPLAGPAGPVLPAAAPPVAAATPTSPRASAAVARAATTAASAVAGAEKPAAPKIATATAAATGGATDPFTYFVQAGAYARTEDAEQQRARLAMLGMEGKLTEREQAGRTVYRVRVGPFEKKADADAAKDTLAGAGVDAALVRIQR